MESKGGKKKSSSSSLEYEAPLGYSIEDVRPAGGIKKFQSAAYSNQSTMICFLSINVLTKLTLEFALRSHPEYPFTKQTCLLQQPKPLSQFLFSLPL
ncbi:Small-uORF [Rhynchospora pubera]|uniref:Small-uORF n=1 Tax=Rhynchospora pubera TaxID=906938 RepID=A0AAV8HFQ7_9POAL|nr:Small-uORF [Rhynchospora pubera]